MRIYAFTPEKIPLAFIAAYLSANIKRFHVHYISVPGEIWNLHPPYIAGYFAGQTALPAFRILGSVVALRRDLSVSSEPFWNRESTRRLALAFVAIKTPATISQMKVLAKYFIMITAPETPPAKPFLHKKYICIGWPPVAAGVTLE